MRLEQREWTRGATPVALRDADLVLCFWSPGAGDAELFARLRSAYPRAVVLGCSTAGEVVGPHLRVGSVQVTAAHFARTRVALASVPLRDRARSDEAGRDLVARLSPEGLRHVWVLSDGAHVNGSALVRGIRDAAPPGVTISGGMAGGGERMHETMVMADGPPASHIVAALGLYGDAVHVRTGSGGGWDPFGAERLVTDAEGSVLRALDHGSALGLYRSYLGRFADDLPASGLRFPLSIRAPGATESVVRTLLGVDPVHDRMTFAGDVPVGNYARFMKANVDRLVDGATSATLALEGNGTPRLALLVSCVGRRLLMGQRTEEELEGVRLGLGDGATMTGFYANGEIGPGPGGAPVLHNQTMTVTLVEER